MFSVSAANFTFFVSPERVNVYSSNALYSAAIVMIPLLSLFYFTRRTRTWMPPSAPILGKSGDRDFRAAIYEGYSKHKNHIFKVPTAHHPTTLVPPEFVDELKNLPDEILSFEKEVTARFLGKYTGLCINDALVQSVKVDLTKNIPQILGELQEEVGYAIGKHIGGCGDWTEYPLYDTLLHLVALLSGRIFVGLPLSREEEWLDATIRYTVDAFVGAEKLWNYPRWSHPLMRYLLPEVRKLDNYLKNGARMLAPSIQERNQSRSMDKAPKRSDMIQWIIQNSPIGNRGDIGYVTKTQMLISMVAIHTTTMTMTQIIFDLLAHPEYIEILRNEILEVKPDEKEPWTKAKIAELRKMDSFMKESQRFRPPGLLTLTRQVERDFKLSNGAVLEQGAHIGVAAGPNALDPELYEEPLRFDALRFLKLRELQGNENKYSFVSVGPGELHWGAGRHACPGRFFASYEIKMLLAKILIDYDMKGNTKERPPDVAIEIRVIPNPTATVSFKGRERDARRS